MADQQTSLAIVIEAINKASATLKEVEKDLGKLSGAVGEQGATAKTAALGFGELVAGVALGGITAKIAVSAFQKLISTLASLPKMFLDVAAGASEIEGLAIAMHVVANNAGVTAEAVDKVRDSVVDQNVTTVAANRLLTDLIRNQVDYTQATELAAAAQNIAVASGVSSSETIERISQSISSGNTWLLRQLGLVEHLDNIYRRYAGTLGKTSEELTESQRKQAVVNYILQEGEKYTGAYGAAMKNAGKIIRSTKDRVKEITYSLGKIFGPVLYEITKTIYDFVSSIVKWAHENDAKLRAIAKSVGEFVHGVVASIKSFITSIPWDYLVDALSWVTKQLASFAQGLRVVFNVVQIFVRGIQESIATVKSFGEALWALARGDFKALRGVYTEWKDYSAKTGEAIMGDLGDITNAFSSSYKAQTFNLREYWKKVGQSDSAGWEDRFKQTEEGGEQLSAKQKKKLQKMLRDIEKANRDYQRAVEKRVKDFNESFEDLVISHRDAIGKLTEDLEEESRDYHDKLADLAEDYEDAMDEIEARHKKKTESIKEDMEDERKKVEEEVKKIAKKYNEETTLIKREAEARFGNLKSQLDKEKALGDNADKHKVNALEQMIAFEQNGLKTALDDKKDKYDEEVGDVKDKLQEKLDKIKKELNEENKIFADAFVERKEKYDEDVADAKESYEKKRAKLQEELDKELAIREKYAEEFKSIGDKQTEDDITRLVRKHEEELAEMERDHQEKVAEMESKGLDEGSSYVGGLTNGLQSGYPQFKSEINKISSDIDSVTKKTSELGKFDFGLPQEAWPSGQLFGGGGGGSWAKGGLASHPGIVGEAGPEVVLPLNFPKRMAMVMKSLGIGGGGGGQVTQNFYVTVQDKQDVDVLMERAGFALKQGGGYS